MDGLHGLGHFFIQDTQLVSSSRLQEREEVWLQFSRSLQEEKTFVCYSQFVY